MAIPFIDDLIAWLYEFLGKIGSILASVGLLLSAVMVGIRLSTGALPHWSALDLGIQTPHTSISAIDELLTYWSTGSFGIPVALIAIGMTLNLTFGRWARQMANAEAELYSSPASQADPASTVSRGRGIRST